MVVQIQRYMIVSFEANSVHEKEKGEHDEDNILYSSTLLLSRVSFVLWSSSS